MLAACLLGILVDSLQQGFGLFTFTRDPAWPLWLPLWVFVIWAQFATLFHYALHWLSGRYLLAAIFGLVGGPLAYWAGIRMGAASFGDNPTLTVVTLAIVWALVTPLLCRLSDLIDKEEGIFKDLDIDENVVNNMIMKAREILIGMIPNWKEDTEAKIRVEIQQRNELSHGGIQQGWHK